MSDVKTRLWFDDGDITVERIQDVEPIIERNKTLQTLSQARAASFHHVGSIPNVIIEKWIVEEGAPVLSMSKEEFARFIRKKLNDPAWRYLKTTPGNL